MIVSGHTHAASTAVLFALIPVAAMAIGALTATVYPPGKRVRSAIQHLAAGVIFSVVGVELLPDIMAIHGDILETAGGFALGVVTMLLLERVTGGHEHAREGAAKGAVSMLVPVGVDLLLNGFLVGIAFAVGAAEGTLLSLALAFETLSLGLALTIRLRRSGASQAASVWVPIALTAATLLGGTALGATILAGTSPAIMVTVLAFGAAALLFLVTEELLVEAHEVGETPWATAMFFAGFLFLLVLAMAAR